MGDGINIFYSKGYFLSFFKPYSFSLLGKYSETSLLIPVTLFPYFAFLTFLHKKKEKS